MAGVRAFVAVRFPGEIEKAVFELMDRLRRRFGCLPVRVKWVEPENLHVTLKFLGDVEAGRIGELAARFGEVARAAAPFRVGLRGVAGFPGGHRPRVIVVPAALGAGEISLLARRLEDAAEELGFEREERPFRPHLTIGRNKDPRPVRGLAEILAEHAAFAAGPAEIREIALMKSTLRPEGPIYETMARLPFGGAADRPSPTGD